MRHVNHPCTVPSIQRTLDSGLSPRLHALETDVPVCLGKPSRADVQQYFDDVLAAWDGVFLLWHLSGYTVTRLALINGAMRGESLAVFIWLEDFLVQSRTVGDFGDLPFDPDCPGNWSLAFELAPLTWLEDTGGPAIDISIPFRWASTLTTEELGLKVKGTASARKKGWLTVHLAKGAPEDPGVAQVFGRWLSEAMVAWVNKRAPRALYEESACAGLLPMYDARGWTLVPHNDSGSADELGALLVAVQEAGDGWLAQIEQTDLMMFLQEEAGVAAYAKGVPVSYERRTLQVKDATFQPWSLIELLESETIELEALVENAIPTRSYTWLLVMLEQLGVLQTSGSLQVRVAVKKAAVLGSAGSRASAAEAAAITVVTRLLHSARWQTFIELEREWRLHRAQVESAWQPTVTALYDLLHDVEYGSRPSFKEALERMAGIEKQLAPLLAKIDSAYLREHYTPPLEGMKKDWRNGRLWLRVRDALLISSGDHESVIDPSEAADCKRLLEWLATDLLPEFEKRYKKIKPLYDRLTGPLLEQIARDLKESVQPTLDPALYGDLSEDARKAATGLEGLKRGAAGMTAPELSRHLGHLFTLVFYLQDYATREGIFAAQDQSSPSVKNYFEILKFVTEATTAITGITVCGIGLIAKEMGFADQVAAMRALSLKIAGSAAISAVKSALDLCIHICTLVDPNAGDDAKLDAAVGATVAALNLAGALGQIGVQAEVAAVAGGFVATWAGPLAISITLTYPVFKFAVREMFEMKLAAVEGAQRPLLEKVAYYRGLLEVLSQLLRKSYLLRQRFAETQDEPGYATVIREITVAAATTLLYFFETVQHRALSELRGRLRDIRKELFDLFPDESDIEGVYLVSRVGGVASHTELIWRLCTELIPILDEVLAMDRRRLAGETVLKWY